MKTYNPDDPESNPRLEFRVSTKVALFNADRSKVVVIDIGRDGQFGLPGGHIDSGEAPDEAIVREIREECGVGVSKLERADFFVHQDGKIVLAYTGIADSEEFNSEQDNFEGVPKWLTKAEFELIGIDPGYREFVLKVW